MSNVLDLIRQAVSGTPGTGAISLGSGETGYIGIQDHPDTVDGMTIDYSIVDGNNKEFGIGTYSTTGDVLTRTWIQGKLESGTFTKNPGTGLNLTSSAIVSCSPIASRHQFRGCELELTADQSIADSSTVLINWNSEIFDTDGFHDNATNNSRITIPSGLGIKKVEFIFLGTFTGNGVGERNFGIANKLGNVVSGCGMRPPSAYKSRASVTTGVISVNDGDYFEAQVYQSSGGTLNFETGTSSRFKLRVIE